MAIYIRNKELLDNIPVTLIKSKIRKKLCSQPRIHASIFIKKPESDVFTVSDVLCSKSDCQIADCPLRRLTHV